MIATLEKNNEVSSSNYYMLVTLALQFLCWMTTLSQITWLRMGVVLVYIINYWNLAQYEL